MLVAFAGALIAAGGALFLATLVSPPDVSASSLDEYERDTRNFRLQTLLSGTFTLLGAALLLLGSRWLYALLGVGAAASVTYIAQVIVTHRAWVALDDQARFEFDSTGGRVFVLTASRVGLIPSRADAEFALASHALPSDQGTPTLAITARRSRWRWAFTHPLGGPNAPAFRPRRSA